MRSPIDAVREGHPSAAPRPETLTLLPHPPRWQLCMLLLVWSGCHADSALEPAGASGAPAVAGADVDAGNSALPGIGFIDATDNSDSWPADCEQRLLFKAHGQAVSGDPSKYELKAGTERVATFYFTSPWDGDKVQLIKSRERIDNRKVIHHWMLYAMNTTQNVDGEILGDPDHADANLVLGGQYVLGGVPGATNVTIPDDVGMRLPSGTNLAFSLEIHYFNGGDATESDSTGVEVCVTSKKRPHEAAAHWLGTLDLDLPAHAKTNVVTTCRPTMLRGPAHIMAITPHMHRTGAYAKAVLTRSSGEKLTLLDNPYVFQEQRLYRMPADGSTADLVVNPGDTITTTCGFDNETDKPIMWGEQTSDEMCFLTVWAWPAGSLHNDSLAGTWLGLPQDQSCVEP